MRYERSLAIILLAFSSCAHITPVTDVPGQPSFDGNNQNSGIIQKLVEISPDGDEESMGYEITENARERYNKYIENYGDKLTPPIAKDFGITPYLLGHYKLTMEAADKWYEMVLLSQREKIDKSDTLLHKVGVQ